MNDKLTVLSINDWEMGDNGEQFYYVTNLENNIYVQMIRNKQEERWWAIYQKNSSFELIPSETTKDVNELVIQVDNWIKNNFFIKNLH